MSTQSHEAQNEHRNHYLIPFLLIFIFAIVESLGGWWTGSLALLSDAAHMFTDVAAL
ncbi:MAG TPA: cation transporter, partial [Methylotenera sp.]|nr:cation transporter [Methylotenera sp.]